MCFSAHNKNQTCYSERIFLSGKFSRFMEILIHDCYLMLIIFELVL